MSTPYNNQRALARARAGAGARRLPAAVAAQNRPPRCRRSRSGSHRMSVTVHGLRPAAPCASIRAGSTAIPSFRDARAPNMD